MASFTENLHLKRQIQQLTEQNYRLRRLISEAQNPKPPIVLPMPSFEPEEPSMDDPSPARPSFTDTLNTILQQLAYCNQNPGRCSQDYIDSLMKLYSNSGNYRKVNEQNYRLRRLISEATQTPTDSGVERVSTPQTGGPLTGYAKDSMYSPQGYGRQSGRGGRGGQGNGTGGPLYIPGYLPPNIMSLIYSMFEELGVADQYIDYNTGQINWMNWYLSITNDQSFGNNVASPILQGIRSQLGVTALQQFITAFRQWQGTLSRG